MKLRISITVTVDEAPTRAAAPPLTVPFAPRSSRSWWKAHTTVIPIWMQDPSLTTEGPNGVGIQIFANEFRDGPATDQIELSGASTHPWTGDRFEGMLPLEAGARVHIDDRDDLAVRAHVFGAACATLRTFERADVLGRQVQWAFDGPLTLRLLPSNELNAAYRRSERAVILSAGAAIQTAASLDVIAHELTHAVVDGLCPDLHDAFEPECAAIHEALADLAAVATASELCPLRVALIRASTADPFERAFETLGQIAEQVGSAMHGQPGVRNLFTAQPPDLRATDAVDAGPHRLSLALSVPLFERFRELIRVVVQEDASTRTDPVRALAAASRQFLRFVFRAVDYLPPGELVMADVIRAIWAVDAWIHPDFGPESPREVLARRAVEIGMVNQTSAIRTPTNQPDPRLSHLDRARFLEDDGYAQAFIQQHRALFGVPEDVEFEVWPRVSPERVVQRGVRRERLSQIVCKVRWFRDEPSADAAGGRRRVRAGSTTAFGLGDLVDVQLMSTPHHPAAAARRDRQVDTLRRLGLLEAPAHPPADGPLEVHGTITRLHPDPRQGNAR